MTENITPGQELPITEKKSGGCGCGCGHEAEIPRLDVRVIPHAVRHGAVFGALGQLRVGMQMDLVANHAPMPLLEQLKQLAGDAYTWEFTQDGPEEWVVRFTREQ